MTQAIIYTRFSPRPDAATSESNRHQLRRCRAYCQANGYTVIGVRWDRALSGGRADNRPGLQRALAQACEQKAVLTMLERMPAHVAWVFTTTTAGQESLFGDCIDAGPILSRCVVVALDKGDAGERCKAFAGRVREIAVHENIDGLPGTAYTDLYYRCKGNFRAMLMAVESGELSL